MLKVRKIALCVLLALLLCFCDLLSITYYTYANTDTIYTEVLQDLSKDTNFNLNNYPVDTSDNSLYFLNIAESGDKELFVYIYQPNSPNGNLQATSINISTANDGKISFVNYKLKLIDSASTLYKYKVDKLYASNLSVRTYEISSIYRKWISGIDDTAPADNTISEVPFLVAKRFTFTTVNNNTTLSVKDVETIEITSKVCGFVRYLSGVYPALFLPYAYPCLDSHFVAFSTNRQIDKLMEADVYYVSQTSHFVYTYYSFPPSSSVKTTYGKEVTSVAELKYAQKTSVDLGINGRYSYSWDRIQSANEFIAGENMENVYTILGVVDKTTEINLTEEARNYIRDEQWVLRFAETPYSGTYVPVGASSRKIIDKTIVSDVSILRLLFEYDGNIYNMGVIDNKQSGSAEPMNYYKTTYSLNSDFLKLFKIILGIALLALIISLLSPILPVIGKGIKAVVTAPFKLAKRVKKGIKEDKAKNNRKHKKGGGKK